MPADRSIALVVRRDAAAYIRAHPADFAPYLAAEGAEDGSGAQSIEEYCNTIEDRAEWGGANTK